MARVVYLISHGHTARGFRQTDLLGHLVRKGLEVVVVAKDDPEGTLKDYTRANGAELIAFKKKYKRSNQQKDILRNYVFQDIRHNPALLEKHFRRTQDSKIGWKRKLVNKLYFAIGRFFTTFPFLRPIYAFFDRRTYQDSSAIQLLKELKPEIVVSTRPVDDMEKYLLNAARRLNINRVFYILSWDNITAKGIFPEKANFYLTWGNIMNQELKEYYKVDDSRIRTCGVTHFDVHYEVDKKSDASKYLESLGLRKENPYLFFTMSAPYFCPDELLIVEQLAEDIETGIYGPDMQLIIRPHIQNVQGNIADPSWLPRLESLVSNRVGLDRPETEKSELSWSMKGDDMIKLSNLLKGAAVCLNSGSTIAIEATLMNRPVVIPAFDVQDGREWWESVTRLETFIHLDKLYKYNAIALVRSFQELREAINGYLRSPDLDAEARAEAAKNECYRFDGQSTERVAQYIDQLARYGDYQS